MAYLIDTDIFISAKNLHYGMDFCPGFWDWIVEANQTGKLISIEAVYQDLIFGEDELEQWSRERDKNFFLPPGPQDITALGAVSRWVNEHQTYTPAAKQTFLSCSDYFIVAQALAGGHTVISNEKPQHSINRIKIPNACLELGIQFLTPWQMLRQEHVKLILHRMPPSENTKNAFQFN